MKDLDKTSKNHDDYRYIITTTRTKQPLLPPNDSKHFDLHKRLQNRAQHGRSVDFVRLQIF